MFLNILKNWPIDLNKSLMIGDKITDEIAAKKTGIKFTYYKNIIQKFLFNLRCDTFGIKTVIHL